MLHLLCSAYNLVIGNSIELVAVVKCFKQLSTFFFQAKPIVTGIILAISADLDWHVLLANLHCFCHRC
jgi:hypothetical protein